MPYEIKGNWEKGFAFDIHTVSSSYLGVDELGHERFENVRSKMGELVYQLKYRGNLEVVTAIVELLDRIGRIETYDRIVPIPPTVASRTIQPVRLIAEALGERRGVLVLPDLLSKTKGGQQLKNVTDPAEREKLLKGSMVLSQRHDVSGLKVLLVDDLFGSGATLRTATEVLINEGRAATVSVLTMTKKR